MDVALANKTNAPAADRVHMQAFLSAFSVFKTANPLIPDLICNKGTRFACPFMKCEDLDRGSSGEVYLYKALGSAFGPCDTVCLKVLEKSDPDEEAALRQIAMVNDKLAGLPDIDCDIINARLLKSGSPMYVLMEAGERSLRKLERNLSPQEALVVVRAMTEEAISVLDAYGLLLSDIKTSNFLYTSIDEDTVNVRSCDFGGMLEPGGARSITDITTHPMPRDAYPRSSPGACEEQAVYALGCTLINLCKSVELDHTGFFNPSSADDINDIYDHIGMNINHERFVAAVAYAFQIDDAGVVRANAGKGVTLQTFLRVISK